MVTKRKVLTFIAERTVRGRAVSAEDLAAEFWSLSTDSACAHLRRLWRERLVETLLPRPRGFRYRLEPGEPILPLRFQLTARGKDWLRWSAKHQKGEEGFGLDDLMRLFK